MKTKFTSITILLLTVMTIASQADKRNVLFIGNSYTFYNGGLQNMVASIATSLGDTLTHDNSLPGGYTAQLHASNSTTLSKIAQGGWDYVTIQCQSQEPSFPIGQVNTQTLPYILQLDSAIQAGSSCAETLFFMTWGRKVGDLGNFPNDTYDAMQQRLRDGYLYFADSANGSVSPVGAAWKVMRDSLPLIDLYDPDGSHPSVNGTYLSACVFYCSMFKKSCVGSMYLPSGVGNGDAFAMQNIASMVVLDSLENWHKDGGIPNANYTYNTWPGSPNQLNFINNSYRFANSAWNFGDGSPIDNSTSPNHTYSASGGTYNVCLEVTSACGKKDTTCQTIMIAPSTTSDFSATDKIKIYTTGHNITLNNDFGNCTFILKDINGRILKRIDLSSGQSSVSTTDLTSGIYILQIESNGKLLKLQKVWNN